MVLDAPLILPNYSNLPFTVLQPCDMTLTLPSTINNVPPRLSPSAALCRSEPPGWQDQLPYWCLLLYLNSGFPIAMWYVICKGELTLEGSLRKVVDELLGWALGWVWWCILLRVCVWWTWTDGRR